MTSTNLRHGPGSLGGRCEDDNPRAWIEKQETDGETDKFTKKKETLVLWKSQSEGGMRGQGGCSLNWALSGDQR